MKEEEIDRRIGMPDIDAEWARFEREVMHQKPLPLRPSRRISRTAAVVALVLGISLTALASAYIFRVVIPARHSSGLATTHDEDSLKQNTREEDADTTAYFLFDNADMLTIARTLGEHYGVTPVFMDEEVKKVRLYARIEKKMSLDEVVRLLGNFKKVRLSVSDGRLLIASRRDRAAEVSR